MANNVTPYQPQSITEAERLCEKLCKSGMVPRAYQNRPADALVAIMFGAEVGLPPLASLQHVAVINGRPGLFGDAIAGVALKSGAVRAVDEWLEGEAGKDGWTAHCKVTRPDGGTVERTFSVADAKRAGLWGKAGPWQQYPQRMLAARARGYAVRDASPHSFLGYTVEELKDIDAQERTHLKDVTPPTEPAPAVEHRPEPPAPPPPAAEPELQHVVQIRGQDGTAHYTGSIAREALVAYGNAKRHSTDPRAVAFANLAALKLILPCVRNGTADKLKREIEATEALLQDEPETVGHDEDGVVLDEFPTMPEAAPDKAEAA